MEKFAGVALVAFLLLVTPAYGQVADPSAQPESRSDQMMMSVTGKITAIDLAEGTLTLDNGTQFRLPQSFQYTSFPSIGQEVEVTYVDQGGQRVARSIDFSGGPSGSSGSESSQ